MVLTHPELAGIHFTGSTRVFQHLWSAVGDNIGGYRSYPRLVGETGGKDFVVAHPSADVDVLRTALVRGAFEYRGRSARPPPARTSRPRCGPRLQGRTGRPRPRRSPWVDVEDLANFTSAVIDDRSFAGSRPRSTERRPPTRSSVLAGGSYDDAVGYFVRPTVLLGTDPRDEIFCTEYFGPILSVHVYPDDEFDADARPRWTSASPYALTGSIIARDRAAVARAKRGAAVHRRQLLHQRQAHRRGRRPAAVRRRRGPPAPTTRPAPPPNLMRWTSPRVDQGDVRRADHRRLPAPARLTGAVPARGRTAVRAPELPGLPVATGPPGAGTGARPWSARPDRRSRPRAGSAG